MNKTYQPGVYLTLTIAASMLAERDIRDDDYPHSSKDRWRSRIKYATENGTLSRNDGRYLIEDVVRWAMQLNGETEWQSKFSDLPKSVSVTETMTERARVSSETDGHIYPADIESSHAEIHRLHVDIQSLQEELKVLRKESDLLRPKAEKYDHICESNSKAARKKRDY